MIEKNMYTVFDSVAQECGPVFFANNDEHALRLFGQMTSKTPDISADDFQLYRVGVFNSSAHMIINADYALVTADSVINNDDDDFIQTADLSN